MGAPSFAQFAKGGSAKMLAHWAQSPTAAGLQMDEAAGTVMITITPRRYERIC